MQQQQRTVLKWFVVVMVVIATLAGVFYATTHFADIRRQLTLATSRQPEPFTELYFADLSRIPATAVVGQKIPVSFVIRNQETQDTVYTYRLYFTDSQGTTLYGDHTVSVAIGQFQTISGEITVPAGQGRGSLGVQLVNKGQSVHFWLEREQAL